MDSERLAQRLVDALGVYAALALVLVVGVALIVFGAWLALWGVKRMRRGLTEIRDDLRRGRR